MPPDAVIQFSPQPLISLASGSAPLAWQGQFSEQLHDSPPPGATAGTPTAWLVSVVFNLKATPTQPPALSPTVVAGIGPVTLSFAYAISGSATETLTPLDPSGNPIPNGQVWIGDNSIQSCGSFVPSIPLDPLNSSASTFEFSTVTTNTQTMTPLATSRQAQAALPLWIATTTNHTTGTIVEAAALTSGTFSQTEQVSQKLLEVTTSPPAISGPWTVTAQFAAAGSFQVTPAVFLSFPLLTQSSFPTLPLGSTTTTE